MDEQLQRCDKSTIRTRIVVMEESDLDEVLSIEASSRQTSWSHHSFVEEIKSPLSFCFVLRGGNEPTERVFGFICFRVIGEESDLLNLAVLSQYRHMGLGKELMKFYVDFCRERKTKIFYLETGVSNGAAIHLYESFDYHPAGIRAKLFRGKEDALLMVRRARTEEISR
jgi:[ribosomal protein S18]-alanine N-acetyltransferase